MTVGVTTFWSTPEGYTRAGGHTSEASRGGEGGFRWHEINLFW